MDGQGISWFLKMAAGDNDDTSGMPGLPPFGFLKWCLVHLAGPLLTLIHFYEDA
jgi:hypothetical protein